jgi:hypothetical protein
MIEQIVPCYTGDVCFTTFGLAVTCFMSSLCGIVMYEFLNWLSRKFLK